MSAKVANRVVIGLCAICAQQTFYWCFAIIAPGSHAVHIGLAGLYVTALASYFLIMRPGEEEK